jgi:glycosyltransferase involved in cell wall biosynthesis
VAAVGDDRDMLPGEPFPDLTGLRVLHVVQKYSSGVGAVIAQYTRTLPEAEHFLLSGTPLDGEGDLAEQAVFAGTRRMCGGALGKARRVREVVAELRPDVVHAHSSHGGLYARLGIGRFEHPLVYTPHCYAFERRDVSATARAAFRMAEALLAVNTTAFAACSRREVELSRWPTRRAPRVLVPNIAPAVPQGLRAPSPEALVVGGGRLSPQKDPGFFLEVIRRLRQHRPELRALWLGDDDDTVAQGTVPRRRDLEAAGVAVSGWLPREATQRLLGTARVYLHSARWEGFPLMVAEAAALRVPTFVRELPSFTGVPRALTMASGADLTALLACLDDEQAAAANVAGWSEVLRTNTLSDQRAALAGIYAAVAGR